KTLLDSDVIRFLDNREQIVFWGCNIKSPEGYRVSRTLREHTYPFIGVIGLTNLTVPEFGHFANSTIGMALLGRIEGAVQPIDLIQQLTSIFEEHQGATIAARLDRREREAAARIREEQDLAYKQSLERDRAKLAAREEQQRNAALEAAEQARLRRRQDALKQARVNRRKRWRVCLPPEPEQNSPSTVQLSVKLPNGRRVHRTFRVNDSILYYFILSHDDAPENFEIQANFPKRLLPCQPEQESDLEDYIDGEDESSADASCPASTGKHSISADTKTGDLNVVSDWSPHSPTDPPTFLQLGLSKPEVLFVIDKDAETPMTSAAEFAGNAFHTLLWSVFDLPCLVGNFRVIVGKGSWRMSVKRHMEHVTTFPYLQSGLRLVTSKLLDVRSACDECSYWPRTDDVQHATEEVTPHHPYRSIARKTRTPRLAIEKLVDPEVKRNYQNQLVECLPDGTVSDINGHWEKISKALLKVGTSVCGTTQPTPSKHWISDRTVSLLETRRQIPPGRHHNSTRRIIRRQVKLSVRADREAWWTRKAQEMEDAKNAGNDRQDEYLQHSLHYRKAVTESIKSRLIGAAKAIRIACSSVTELPLYYALNRIIASRNGDSKHNRSAVEPIRCTASCNSEEIRGIRYCSVART
ncbi:FAS-associated factor 2, partial [Clonorchis sinensis]